MNVGILGIRELKWMQKGEINSDDPYTQKTNMSASLTTLKSLTEWFTTNCGKFLKRCEIPYQLLCFMKNMCAGQESTVRTRHGAMDWYQIGKRVCQGCVFSLSLFNLYAEFSSVLLHCLH